MDPGTRPSHSFVERRSGGYFAFTRSADGGDNLPALKALLAYYAGQVKCIYMDPP
jgi:hypothetical protein